MKKSDTYLAPMDGLTLGITLAVAVLCMGVPIFLYSRVHDLTIFIKLACVAPIFFLLATSLFAIKSYHLEEGVLCIKRTLWITRISLKPLESAEFNPGIMTKSLRLCGNGGLFGWLGWFRNKALGNYRAWVTDRNKTVVLKVGGKTYVISPMNPEKFVKALQPLQT